MLCELAYEVFDSVPGELEYIVRQEKEFTYIVIRGTEFGNKFSAWGLSDFWRNMRVLPFRSKHTGWLHAGYLAGAQLIFHDLKKIARLSERLVISGHSMGAAVAAPLAQLMHPLTPVTKLVLFGTPKIYMRTPKLDFPVISYRNGSDIITYAHPQYRHPAPIIEIAPNPLPVNFFDHQISEYIKSLQALIDE